jgi:hypothetical protein
MSKGFKNIRAIRGGIEAMINAGFTWNRAGDILVGHELIFRSP